MFRISEQKVNISKNVKYLGSSQDEHLDWTEYLNTLVPRRNRATGFISRIRHYISKTHLRTLYFSLIYTCQPWGQEESVLRKISVLPNKAMRIVNFKSFANPVDELCSSNKIIKITDYSIC